MKRPYDNRTILIDHEFIELSYWTESYADIYKLQLGQLGLWLDVQDNVRLKFRNYSEPNLFYFSLQILWFAFSISLGRNYSE